MNVILLALGVLGVLGAVGSLVLYFVSKKFYVYEDPRVGQVELMHASRRRMPAIRWATCSVLSAVPTAWQKLLESSELRQVPLNLNLLWFDAMATWNVVLNFQPMMA